MVGSLYHVISVNAREGARRNGVCFKNVASLVMSETAAFDVVGIVSQLNLDLVIDAAGDALAVFTAKSLFQGRAGIFRVFAFGLMSRGGDLPDAASNNSTRDAAILAIFANGAFGKLPVF